MQKTEKMKIVSTYVSVDGKTGEVLDEAVVKRYPAEPPFVKMYLDVTLEDVDPRHSVLVALLKKMEYSGAGAESGNCVYLGKAALEEMSKDTGLSEKRLRNMVVDLQEGRIVRKIGVSKYQVNPYLFGKGEWLGVAQLRDSWPLK